MVGNFARHLRLGGEDAEAGLDLSRHRHHELRRRAGVPARRRKSDLPTPVGPATIIGVFLLRAAAAAELRAALRLPVLLRFGLFIRLLLGPCSDWASAWRRSLRFSSTALAPLTTSLRPMYSLSVQFGDGPLGLVHGLHLHKREALGLLGVLVGHDLDILADRRPTPLKSSSEIALGGVEGQIADVKTRRGHFNNLQSAEAGGRSARAGRSERSVRSVRSARSARWGRSVRSGRSLRSGRSARAGVSRGTLPYPLVRAAGAAGFAPKKAAIFCQMVSFFGGTGAVVFLAGGTGSATLAIRPATAPPGWTAVAGWCVV